MAVVEALDVREALGAETQPLAVTLEEGAAEAAPQQEADHVTTHGREPNEPDQRDQLHTAALGHDTADHHGGLPRYDQPDEGAGLEEREPGDRRIRPAAKGARTILEHAVHVRKRNDTDNQEQRRRGGDSAD